MWLLSSFAGPPVRPTGTPAALCENAVQGFVQRIELAVAHALQKSAKPLFRDRAEQSQRRIQVGQAFGGGGASWGTARRQPACDVARAFVVEISAKTLSPAALPLSTLRQTEVKGDYGPSTSGP